MTMWSIIALLSLGVAVITGASIWYAQTSDINRTPAKPMLPHVPYFVGTGVGWAIVGGVFLAIVMAAVTFVSMEVVQQQQVSEALSTRGVESTATVVERDIRQQAGRPPIDFYFLTYSYTAEGETFTQEERVPANFYEAHPVDSSLSIIYDPQNPATAQRQAATIGGSGASILILTALGILALISGWVIYQGAAIIKYARALDATGQMTEGTLTHRWSPISEKKGGYFFVAYQFQAADEPISRTERNKNIYEQFQEGDAVPVRYLPTNPQICRLEG